MSLRTGPFQAVALAVAGLLLTGCAGDTAILHPLLRRDPRAAPPVGLCRAARRPGADRIRGDLPPSTDPCQDHRGEPSGGRGGREPPGLPTGSRRHALRADPSGAGSRFRPVAGATRCAAGPTTTAGRLARRTGCSASRTRAADCPTRARSSRTTGPGFTAPGTASRGSRSRGPSTMSWPSTTTASRATRPWTGRAARRGQGRRHLDPRGPRGPTQGCVSLPRARMKELLRWLEPGEAAGGGDGRRGRRWTLTGGRSRLARTGPVSARVRNRPGPTP